jgi:hypothetical protein
MARTFRRSTTVVLATALLSLGLGVAPAIAGAEGDFVKKINSARASNGKAPVQVYWDLTDDARRHSKKMMERGEIFHNSNLGSVTTGWKALGENVGVGPSVNLLFDAFMQSSAHRKNILGGYNYVGVGVAIESDSLMWVTMIFMLGPDDLLDPPDTTTTTTTTTTQPPATTTTTTTRPPTATTTTTTQPPATTTTTTTRPPTATTTTQPPSTTTTTTLSPPNDPPLEEPTEAVVIEEEEYAALSKDWIPPALFRLIGVVGR